MKMNKYTKIYWKFVFLCVSQYRRCYIFNKEAFINEINLREAEFDFNTKQTFKTSNFNAGSILESYMTAITDPNERFLFSTRGEIHRVTVEDDEEEKGQQNETDKMKIYFVKEIEYKKKIAKKKQDLSLQPNNPGDTIKNKAAKKINGVTPNNNEMNKEEETKRNENKKTCDIRIYFIRTSILYQIFDSLVRYNSLKKIAKEEEDTDNLEMLELEQQRFYMNIKKRPIKHFVNDLNIKTEHDEIKPNHGYVIFNNHRLVFIPLNEPTRCYNITSCEICGYSYYDEVSNFINISKEMVMKLIFSTIGMQIFQREALNPKAGIWPCIAVITRGDNWYIREDYGATGVCGIHENETPDYFNISQAY